eukprot:1155640-Pelagomonas_calceolata.AAC.6
MAGAVYMSHLVLHPCMHAETSHGMLLQEGSAVTVGTATLCHPFVRKGWLCWLSSNACIAFQNDSSLKPGIGVTGHQGKLAWLAFTMICVFSPEGFR